jgi:hypothetical protein
MLQKKQRLRIDFEWAAVVVERVVSKEDPTMRASNARGIAPLLAARSRQVAGVIFTVLLFISAPVFSKPKASPAPAAAKAEDRVETRLHEADKVYVEGDFIRALELYKQVDSIDSTPKTRLKIADCLRELGQVSQAYDILELLVKDTTLVAKDKARAEQALKAIGSSTSILALHMSEQEARLVIDGVEVGRGPLDKSLRRKAGHVVVSATKSGFEPWTKELDLAAGEEQRVDVVLVPEKAFGTLVVNVVGKGSANLILDGKDVGPLPWSGDVPAGAHDISAQNAHGISAARRVAVSAKGRMELELTVVENPAKLHVSANSTSAVIRIDGTPYGSGKYDGDVLPGKHAVSVEQPGFVPNVYNFTLEPGEQKSIDNVVLERSPANQSSEAVRNNRGIYVQVALDGLVGKATNSISDACPANSLSGSCTSWPNLGGELDVHVGYSWGIFGAEGFLLGGTNLTSAHAQYPRDVSQNESAWYGIARKETYLIFEPAFGGGAAGRVSTQGKTFRLSTALGLGLVYRATELHRSVETTGSSTPGAVLRKDNTSHWNAGGGSVLPMFIWDSEIQLGDTPGTRAFLGIHSQIEFGSQPTVSPGAGTLGFNVTSGDPLPLGSGPIEVRRSPAFYIGPRFGVTTGS